MKLLPETAAALLRRARGDMSQADLAAAADLAVETIERWESGAREPSLESLRAVVSAAGWELRTELVPAHGRLVALVGEQLQLSPTERLRTLMADDWPACRGALRVAAATFEHAVLVGPLAAAIRGTPQASTGPAVDLLAPAGALPVVQRTLADGGATPAPPATRELEPGERAWTVEDAVITVRSLTPGIDDVAALCARSPLVSMTQAGVPVLRVALVEDLYDLARHSGREADRALLAGLRAVLASGRYSARTDRIVRADPR